MAYKGQIVDIYRTYKGHIRDILEMALTGEGNRQQGVRDSRQQGVRDSRQQGDVC